MHPMVSGTIADQHRAQLFQEAERHRQLRVARERRHDLRMDRPVRQPQRRKALGAVLAALRPVRVAHSR